MIFNQFPVLLFLGVKYPEKNQQKKSACFFPTWYVIFLYAFFLPHFRVEQKCSYIWDDLVYSTPEILN